MGILITFHVIMCVVLIGLILIQRGRGGGFVDSFQGLETVLGTKTSAFLTRATSVLAVLFFVSCLTLAFLSLRQSRSLIGNSPVPPPVQQNTTAPGEAQKESGQEQAAPAQPQSSQPAAPAQAPAQAPAGNSTQSAE